MERKIGEIFEYKGEWYQCVEGYHCYDCDFRHKNGTCIIYANYPESKMGNCNGDYRTDNKNVVFKKLEKVGEPYVIEKVLYQHYKVFDIDNVYGDGFFWCVHNYKARTLTIGLKQNKEDMEEKKQKLDKLVDDYMACRIQYAEFDKEIKALYDKEESKPTLKEFDLEAAKAGKPVCTRDGRKARIICFDARDAKVGPTIVALIETSNGYESIERYNMQGKFLVEGCDSYDLMMLPEKKEGWIVIHKEAIYDKETAEKIARETTANVIKIQKIEWEE